MAGKDDGLILSRLDDLAGRLATAKSLGDAQETLGRVATQKQVIESGETMTKILAEVKGLRSEMAELRESQEKGLRKLREEVMDAVENIEVEGGDGDPETLNFLKEQVGEFKSLAKAILGDDTTVEAIRSKVRNVLGFKGGGGKKGLPSGDDE